jgi:hypothetical protein
MKRWIALLLGILLVSCGRSAPSAVPTGTVETPNPQTSPSQTSTPAPATKMPTKQPTATTIPGKFPTLRADDDLSGEGPYLLSLLRQDESWKILYFAPGGGGGVVGLPEDIGKTEKFRRVELSGDGEWLLLANQDVWYLYNTKSREIRLLSEYDIVTYFGYQFGNKSFFSGDSKYLAYYSGSNPDDCVDGDPTMCEAFLHVMRLSDGKVIKDINLLPENYPDNFGILDELWEDPEVPNQPSYITFFTGLGVFEWSPDSRYLAFSGAIVGPSTDVYILDVNNQHIERITDGPYNVMDLEWDPSGKYIINRSTNMEGCGGGPCGDYYYSPVNGDPSIALDNMGYCISTYSAIVWWQSPTKLLCWSFDELVTYNLFSQEIQSLLPMNIHGMAPDEDSRTLLLETEEYILYEESSGKTIPVDVAGKCHFDGWSAMMSISYLDYRFFIACQSKIYFISPDGNIREMPYAPLIVGASPTGKWLVFYFEDGTLMIFDERGNPVNQTKTALFVRDGPISAQADVFYEKNFIWLPNESGAVVLGENAIFYLSAPDLQREDIAEKGNFYPIGWIPV